jgi:hypothetical protein
VEINTELILSVLRVKREMTFSIGIGKSMKEAYIALKYAKACGKNALSIVEDDIFKLVKNI